MASKTKRAPSASRAATAQKAGGPATRPSRRPGLWSRLGAIGRRWLGSDDGLVVVLAFFALVGVVSLWLGLGGPPARFISFVTGMVIGVGRHLLPMGLAVTALRLFQDGRGELGRLNVGLVLSGTSFAGLAHLARLDEGLEIDIDGWRRAGGALGALAADPLRSAAGPVATALLLVVVGVAGLLLVLRLSLRQLAAAVRRGMGLAAGASRSGVDRLLSLGPPAAPAASEDTPSPPPRQRPPRSETASTSPEEVIAAIPVAAEDLVLQAPTSHREATEARQLALALGEERWKLPPLPLLTKGTTKPVDRRLVEKGGAALEATLGEFGVDARLVGMTIGPTVTRYELELGPGVKVNKVTGLSHDIAYAMASPDVRIIAPIPGRSAIGVEVPNRQRQLVTLGDILDSDEARGAIHPLEVGLGRDIAGRPVVVNLASMPHLLIAGATGAGKSSCINSLITSVLMRSTPEQVRMILVDPKRVELGVYNDLPHLLTPVVVNPKKAANALDWAVREMEMRYDLLHEVGVRDINGYNAVFDRGDLRDSPGGAGVSPVDDRGAGVSPVDDRGAGVSPVDDRGPGVSPVDDSSETRYERLPYILVVVDELNDLMMVAARDVETSICRIAQMARAVGIHLVIATQRPSVDVITGVIKANIPSRLAFSVSSLADSRVILDTPGAEKLVGQGDMLLLTASSSRCQRIQGAWVDESDVHKVAAHWRRQTTELRYVQGLVGQGAEGGRDSLGSEEGDDLLDEAMDLIVRNRLGSTSMLQRKLRVGFARAGRLMDLLERRGVVGPSEGSKARSVLMTVEEIDEIQGRD